VGAQEFTGTSFAEHFTVLDQNARVVAKFADGAAAAYEHVDICRTTERGPKWAGLAQPEWKAPALVELREMDGDKGKLCSC